MTTSTSPVWNWPATPPRPRWRRVTGAPSVTSASSIPPTALRYVGGLTVSAPCQVWTPAGKRAGDQDRNVELLLDVFSAAVEATFGHWHDDGPCYERDDCLICDDPQWDGYGGFTGPLLTYDEARAPIAQMTDERIGLIAEALIWSLALTARYDNIAWLAMEQSSALPDIVLDALSDELTFADWCDTGYQVLDAADVGLASRRRRVFFVDGRYQYVNLAAMQPGKPVSARTAAQALGWPEGVRVNTRGNRRQGADGNEWSADKTAIAVTSKIRGWYWAGDTHRRFTLPEAALLVGMPATYPWAGSRSSSCQQLGDLVAPTEAARVLGPLIHRDWEAKVSRYLTEIYSAHSRQIAAPASPEADPAASVCLMIPGMTEWSLPVEPARPEGLATTVPVQPGGTTRSIPAAQKPSARRRRAPAATPAMGPSTPATPPARPRR
ncbi:hypothetical protein ABZ832_10715 [Streptantibioticus parmotrematis]|uniref:hypothetical protein n=1 Tax=Streptantibioticus parmotrematis TaxID=2873249 RepID=UPI0033CA3110